MTNTIPNVPRELLERAVRIPTKASVEENHAAIVDRGRAQSELRALLSAPSPAGVDGLDVVAWRIGFPNNAGYKVYEQRQPWAYEQYGVPSVIVYEVQELCRLSDAQAIIDGLRGEVERLQFSLEVAKTDELSAAVYAETESIKHSLWNAEKECDQQARRVGELEGLLRHAQKQVPTGSGLHMRIDDALSAVCAAAPNIATTSEHSSQPERDPCPMCIKGGICNTPTCGRLLAMPKAY